MERLRNGSRRPPWLGGRSLVFLSAVGALLHHQYAPGKARGTYRGSCGRLSRGVTHSLALSSWNSADDSGERRGARRPLRNRLFFFFFIYSAAGLTEDLRVGIRARIRSSSSTVTRSRPFLRQESSTALMTMPRTNAGIFFMRAAAASSHATVAGDSAPYSIAVAPSVPATDARPRIARRATRRTSGRVGAERIFGHQIAASCRRPGRGSRRSGRSSRTRRIVRRVRCGGECR